MDQSTVQDARHIGRNRRWRCCRIARQRQRQHQPQYVQPCFHGRAVFQAFQRYPFFGESVRAGGGLQALALSASRASVARAEHGGAIPRRGLDDAAAEACPQAHG